MYNLFLIAIKIVSCLTATAQRPWLLAPRTSRGTCALSLPAGAKVSLTGRCSDPLQIHEMSQLVLRGGCVDEHSTIARGFWQRWNPGVHYGITIN